MIIIYSMMIMGSTGVIITFRVSAQFDQNVFMS